MLLPPLIWIRGKSLVILLHPEGRIARQPVLPTAEPQEHQFQVVAPGLLNEAIDQRELEVAFLGLHLRPRYRRQHAVQIAGHQAGPDGLHVFQAAGGVVAQFSSECEERFPVDDQLRRGSLPFEMRDPRGGLRIGLDRDRTGAAGQCDARKHSQFHVCSLPHYWNFIGTEISQPALVNWSTLLTTVPFSFTFLNKIGPTFFPVILAGRLGV